MSRDVAQNASMMITDGRTDFDIERLTGLSLLEIIGLRGQAASEAYKPEGFLAPLRQRATMPASAIAAHCSAASR